MLAHARFQVASTVPSLGSFARLQGARMVLLTGLVIVTFVNQADAAEPENAPQLAPRSSARPLALSPREIRRDRPLQRAEDPQDSPGRLRRTSSWWTAGSLCIVLAVILIVAKLMRHRLPLAATSLPREVIEPLGRCQLDAKQSVYLVRCGSQLLVLGSSGAGLCSLAAITDPQEVDRLAGLCRQAGQRSATEAFSHIFSRHARSDSLRESADDVVSTPSPIAVTTLDALEPRREADHV